MIDTDSDDELPSGWEERVMSDGRVYYANHNFKNTQWTHPVSNKRKTVTGELPYGWEIKTNSEGFLYYIDHINKRTTYTDPRLAFAVEDKGHNTDIRQKFDSSSTAKQVLLGRDLSKKYVIITGANSGLGYETAVSLASHGAHVTLACRDIKRAEDAVDRIRRKLPAARVCGMTCDLASMHSVQAFVQDYTHKQWPLHILILNGAVFGLPYRTTKDGLEETFQVNYLSHYYLTLALLELMSTSVKARVVIMSAESHRFSTLDADSITPRQLSPSYRQYNYIHAYNNSKLCLIVFAQALKEYLSTQSAGCDITVHCVHPGNMIYTRLMRHSWTLTTLALLVRPFAKSKQQGIATTVYCSVARELDDVSGQYYVNCTDCPVSPTAKSGDISHKLWRISEQLVKQILNKQDLNIHADSYVV